MQEYYATRAPEYDKIYLKPERQKDLRAIENWLAHAFDGKSVLEIACGTGYWTQLFAPHAKNVIALDSARETIEIAKQRVSAAKVDFIIGDAYNIPKFDRALDAGFAGFWFSHIAKRDVHKFLKGFGSSLKPGAKVVFLDNLYVEGSSTPISETDLDGNTYQDRKLADGSLHKVLKNFPAREGLMDMLHGIGTKAIYREWQYYWALEYVTT
jgi:ubiquinone/menaquinone biosynthesis C-methylase UbiE